MHVLYKLQEFLGVIVLQMDTTESFSEFVLKDQHFED